jgi:hypothetical protein
MAVDLFPHTSHCEMVMLFERWGKCLPMQGIVPQIPVSHFNHCVSRTISVFLSLVLIL